MLQAYNNAQCTLHPTTMKVEHDVIGTYLNRTYPPPLEQCAPKGMPSPKQNFRAPCQLLT